MSPAEKLMDSLRERERSSREVGLRQALAAAPPEPEVVELMATLRPETALDHLERVFLMLADHRQEMPDEILRTISALLNQTNHLLSHELMIRDNPSAMRELAAIMDQKERP